MAEPIAMRRHLSPWQGQHDVSVVGRGGCKWTQLVVSDVHDLIVV